MIAIIGAGGVGSYLVPVMIRVSKERITVIDGDVLEKRNLDRQLFDESHLRLNKASAMSRMYDVDPMPVWFHEALLMLKEDDWLFCCADNHPCRRGVLRACDRFGCRCIIAANETTSAEAYYYTPGWRGSPLDPRVYFPEIESDNSGDPRAAAMGCTGEAQEQNRQLASANFLAAGLAAHLHMIWAVKAPTLKKDTLCHLPYRLSATLSRLEAFYPKDGQTKGQNE